jgi:hypothetical protein
VNFVVLAPGPLPPFIYAWCDRGPQPSVSWRPRSGHEIERGLGLGPVSLDAHWGQSNTHLSAYFIKRVAITIKQAREHLAQAQRKE